MSKVWKSSPTTAEVVRSGIEWSQRNSAAPKIQCELFLASIFGDAQGVGKAKLAGADFLWRDADANAAMHVAVLRRWEASSVIQALALAGADVDAGDQFGHAPLLRSCKGSDADLINMGALIKAGADVNKKVGWRSWTALLEASQAGAVDSVRCLLAAGADPNEAEFGGVTSLMWACMNLKLDCIQVLVAGGASVSHACAKGFSAMDYVRQAAQGSKDPKMPDTIARIAAACERDAISLHTGASDHLPSRGQGPRL